MKNSDNLVLLLKRKLKGNSWKLTFHDLDNNCIVIATVEGDYENTPIQSLAEYNESGVLFKDNLDKVESPYKLESTQAGDFSYGNLMKGKLVGRKFCRYSGSPEFAKEFSQCNGYIYNPSYLVG